VGRGHCLLIHCGGGPCQPPERPVWAALAGGRTTLIPLGPTIRGETGLQLPRDGRFDGGKRTRRGQHADQITLPLKKTPAILKPPPLPVIACQPQWRAHWITTVTAFQRRRAGCDHPWFRSHSCPAISDHRRRRALCVDGRMPDHRRLPCIGTVHFPATMPRVERKRIWHRDPVRVHFTLEDAITLEDASTRRDIKALGGQITPLIRDRQNPQPAWLSSWWAVRSLPPTTPLKRT